ncbi:hypothetical protein GC175_11900 [bacterium]|nr:hypothetical protein [bacterium]
MPAPKRSLLLVLLFSLLLLTACATAPAAETGSAPDAEAAATESGPKTGGTLNLSFGDDFVTFHPFFDVTNAQFKPIFFEAPLRIGADATFQPWLAESWEVSEDGLTVTLNLRQGVKFHNGRELTADDVVWAVELAKNTELGHHLSDRFGTAVGATAIDPYTVAIEYSEITHSKLDGIARLYIFPQEAAETIETIPVGTGPFKFVEWMPGDELTAERFDDYWQEGLPYLDSVVIKPIPDTQARLLNLNAGSIDLLVGVPLADKSLVARESGMVVTESPAGQGFNAFLLNVNAPPFDNVKVRQAVNYAIDRDKIVQTAYHGAAQMTTLPVASTSWIFPADLVDTYTYDPEKAKALLAEAGFPDGFETQILIRGTGGFLLDQAQVFQQDLAAIGIEAELVPTELPQYWPQLFESQFSIVSHSTGDSSVDPSGTFEGAACCRPFRNFFGIEQDTVWFPEYRDTIFAARAELDQAARAELYRRAMEILLEQGWTIPTTWNQTVYAHRDFIIGFGTDYDGGLLLSEVWLDE